MRRIDKDAISLSMSKAPIDSPLFSQKQTISPELPVEAPLGKPPVFAPDYAHELALQAQGYPLIAGLDEVGRGPLAGPVVAACVILDANNLPEGLDDSKRLTATKRSKLFDAIMDRALAITLCSLSADSIDTSNILAASLSAMKRCVDALPIRADYALIDGNKTPAGLPCPAQTLVKGDQRSLTIAAASIIAKVTRDRMMERAGQIHPAYGLEKHAGYGTALHRQAIEDQGPVRGLHRYSFAPIKGRWSRADGA